MEKVDSFIQHSPTLWTLAGDWEESSFRRRMTVMKTSQGGLVIHSAMALPDSHRRELDQFGPVKAIIIPNSFHASEARWYSERYPEAKIFAPESILEKTKTRCVNAQVLATETSWNSHPWASDIDCIPIEGLRLVAESFFVHCDSQTLVICDMAFNMKESDFQGMERTLMRLNRVGQGFGPSRLATSLFTKNKGIARESYKKVSEMKFDRIIVNHGDIIEKGGHEAFVAAFL
jgi:hypothetical protein